MGFGRPPKEFFTNKLSDGVVMPGLVNAHSRLELSALKERYPSGTGVAGFEQRIRNNPNPPTEQQIRKAALNDLDQAYSRGTYFYNDVSREPGFSDFLRSATRFHGNRFLEIIGYDDKMSEENILHTMLAMDNDPLLLPTPQSVYRSSPKVLQFVREKARFTSMSMHLFEAKDESNYPFEKGSLYRNMEKEQNYVRHQELYHTRILPYLDGMNMLSFKKLFLINLTYANNHDIEYLNEIIPHSAWVLCHRNQEFLGQSRKNWELLKASPIRMLIGTESSVTSGDVSILDEIAAIARTGHYEESELFISATFAAYEYLEIHPSRIPYFLFVGAEPNIESLVKTEKKAMILRG